MDTLRAPGTYVLVIHQSQAVRTRVGVLGFLRFQPGYYLYVGSALGGLRARIARHVRREKRLHWHVDYVLQHARILAIWYSLGPQALECEWARAISRASGIEPTRARLGASDCACHTHLFYAKAEPSLDSWTGLLRSPAGLRALQCGDSGLGLVQSVGSALSSQPNMISSTDGSKAPVDPSEPKSAPNPSST